MIAGRIATQQRRHEVAGLVRRACLARRLLGNGLSTSFAHSLVPPW